MRRADLHAHTTSSDGELSPVELVDLAAERGLSLLAVTDHDTTTGVVSAVEHGSTRSVRVVPGVELSTRVDSGEIHIIGYGIDVESGPLQEELALQRAARRERAAKIVARLDELGIQLPEDLLQSVGAGESIGRPHIARALLETGAAADVQQAFDEYLGPGRPAYVRRRAPWPDQAIALIEAAGGLPVMAHPFSYPGFEERLPELIRNGLRGLEVYYGEYSPDQRQYLAGVARAVDLTATGGSDFHGTGFRAGRELGFVDIPEGVIDRFLAALHAR